MSGLSLSSAVPPLTPHDPQQPNAPPQPHNTQPYLPQNTQQPTQTLPIKPIQLHGVVVGIFGSLVAPFGGFLMSAIKRAYGIKDFDSVIPGHGGVTDRMDCQLVMILFTFVHYQTFIRHAPVGYDRVLSLIAGLKPEDQRRLYEELSRLVGRQRGGGGLAAAAAQAAVGAAAGLEGGVE